MLSATALLAGCGGSLARHADIVSDLATRERVARALASVEALERDGWIATIGVGYGCPPGPAADPATIAPEGDVIGDLQGSAPPDPACTRAVAELDVVRAERSALEREVDDPRALEAWMRAMSELRGTVDDCPRDDSELAAIAAALRFHGDVEPGMVFDAPDARSCTVATLAGGGAIPDASVRDDAEYAEGWFANACLARGGAPGAECGLRGDVSMLGPEPQWIELALRVADEAGAPADARVAYVEIGAPQQAYAFVVVFARGAWRVVFAERAWTGGDVASPLRG